MGALIEKWIRGLGYIDLSAHNSTLAALEYQRDRANGLEDLLNGTEDLLAQKIIELESLKKKIVERAQVPTILKAKTAAEIRRLVEQENEREFEEQANGI